MKRYLFPIQKWYNTTSITYHAILPAVYTRVLYWLHGYKETSETILAKSDLAVYAEKYHVGCQRENTFIAGASMGGFGSLLLGSRYPDLFGKIACISGAFIIDDILIGNPEIIGNVYELWKQRFALSEK